MGWYLLASFSFDLSIYISTVLPLVIHSGVSPSRQALRCHTRVLCKLVTFFSQNPWTLSGLGAFQFGIFFNIFYIPFIFFLISLSQVASLCFTSWPQISVQNVFASCALGITISSLSPHFHLFVYKNRASLFLKNLFCWNWLTLCWYLLISVVFALILCNISSFTFGFPFSFN